MTEEIDCLKCKDFRECMGRAFYVYADLYFCPYQVIWVIENSATLLEGNWPSNPDGSSYVDPNIKTGFGSEAYYVKPEGILGEVEYRMETTGEAGEALIDEIEDGKVTVIVEDDKIRIRGLSRPAWRALMYVQGRKRKKDSYPEWKADKKRRDKNHIFMVLW